VSMKTLSIRQPWAEAIIRLGKDVENRSWSTRHRGPLLIHASKRAEVVICRQLAINPDELVYGAIVGIVDLVDCVQDSTSTWAEKGQWHWILRNPRRLSDPIPMRGRLGLFEISVDLGATGSASHRPL
jgi:ASCH domain